MTQKQLIIFDWDDTIVTSGRLIHDSINRAAVQHGFQAIEFQAAQKYYGLSLRDSFPLLFKDKWENVRDDFYKIYLRDALDYLNVIDASANALRHLHHNDDVHMSIISNKTGDHLRHEVTHTGFAPYFLDIIGAGDTCSDKPSPKIIETLLHRLGQKNHDIANVQPQNIWFVGDSLADIECAHRFGANGIFINVRKHSLGEYGTFEPRLVFNTHEDCRDWMMAHF
jgi:phosphoglycolate phosphatase